jgi:hypothetical protein
MRIFTFVRILLPVLLVLGVGLSAVPSASADVPAQIFKKKYKVVSIVGSQTYEGSAVIDNINWYEYAANSFTSRGGKVWDSHFDRPLSGTATHEVHGATICPRTTLNFADFPDSDGIDLRVYVIQDTDTKAKISAEFMYQVATMDEWGCDPWTLNDNLFNGPFYWTPQQLQFGEISRTYRSLRRKKVVLTLNGTAPGPLSNGGIGSDSYTYKLKIVLKRTAQKAPL